MSGYLIPTLFLFSLKNGTEPKFAKFAKNFKIDFPEKNYEKKTTIWMRAEFSIFYNLLVIT